MYETCIVTEDPEKCKRRSEGVNLRRKQKRWTHQKRKNEEHKTEEEIMKWEIKQENENKKAIESEEKYKSDSEDLMSGRGLILLSWLNS